MGMGMSGVVFGFVHAVIILTVSFFVLFIAAKSESQALKTFGFVIAVFLWISAALIFTKGLTGKNSMMDKMMPGKGCPPMMGGGMQMNQAPGK